MSEVVITSLISGLCVALPSVLATITSNRSNHKLIAYRIDKLEEKVNTHNNLINRMYAVEKKIDIIETKLEGK